MIKGQPDFTTWENYPGGETLEDYCERVNAKLIAHFGIDMRNYTHTIDVVEFWERDDSVNDVALVLLGTPKDMYAYELATQEVAPRPYIGY